MRNIIINSKEIWQCEIERNLLDNRWDNLSSILSFVQPRDGGGEKNRGVAEEKREAPGERYLDTVPLNPSIVERNRFVSARRRTIRKQPFPLPRPSTRNFSQLRENIRFWSFRSLQHSLHSYNSIEIVRLQRLFKFSRTVTTVLTAETLRTDRKSEGKGGRKRERGRRREKDGGSVHEGGGGRRSSSCWNGMRKLVLRKEEEATARVSGVTTAWSTRQACRKRDDTVRGCCAVSEARLQEDP